MSNPVETLQQEIDDLTKLNDQLYQQMKDNVEKLNKKKVILEAYKLVSSDPDLYDKWKLTAELTPKPELPQ